MANYIISTSDLNSGFIYLHLKSIWEQILVVFQPYFWCLFQRFFLNQHLNLKFWFFKIKKLLIVWKKSVHTHPLQLCYSRIWDYFSVYPVLVWNLLVHPTHPCPPKPWGRLFLRTKPPWAALIAVLSYLCVWKSNCFNKHPDPHPKNSSMELLWGEMGWEGVFLA